MVAIAKARTADSLQPNSEPTPAANPTARVATVPAKIAKKVSQPTMKPATGWKASRR